MAPLLWSSSPFLQSGVAAAVATAGGLLVQDPPIPTLTTQPSILVVTMVAHRQHALHNRLPRHFRTRTNLQQRAAFHLRSILHLRKHVLGNPVICLVWRRQTTRTIVRTPYHHGVQPVLATQTRILMGHLRL